MSLWESLNYDPDSTSWHSEAACLGLNPDLFFPEKGDTACSRQAKAICADCTVQEECLNWAMAANEHSGIWGGQSERDRRRIRRKRATTTTERKEVNATPTRKLEAVSLARKAM